MAVIDWTAAISMLGAGGLPYGGGDGGSAPGRQPRQRDAVDLGGT